MQFPQFLPDWPPAPDGFFYVAIALAAAALIGEVLFRLLRMPRIAGYALVGLVAGAVDIPVDVLRHLDALRIIVDIGLALLLFELGSRVSLRWLRANPWLLLSSLLETALTVAAVYALLHFCGYKLPVILAVSSIAACTSPAAVLWVTAESGARGQITERLLLHTALNAMYVLLGSKLAIAYMLQQFRGDVLTAALLPIYLVSGSFLLAVVMAQGVRFLNRRFDLRNQQGAVLLFALLLVVISVVTLAKLSTLLVPLLAGILLRHMSDRPLLWPRHFGTAGAVLVMLMFVLTNMSLHVSALMLGGFVGFAVLGVRLLAKVGGVLLMSLPSGITLKQGLALGLALTPMSGLAFAIAFDFQELFPALYVQAGLVIFGAMAVLELVGPILTRQALRWVDEIGT